VILTRFSRVTFNAAHRYGLTSELLRAEKSINELARHPLPSTFYEGGGLELLRARFPHSDLGIGDDDTGETTDTERSKDIIGLDKESVRRGKPRRRFGGSTISLSSSNTTSADATRTSTPKRRRESSSSSQPQKTHILLNRLLPDSPSQLHRRLPSGSTTSLASTFPRTFPLRDQVNAGDLHTSAANPGLILNITGLGSVMGMGLKTPRPRMTRNSARWGTAARTRRDGRRRSVILHLEEVVEGDVKLEEVEDLDKTKEFNLRDEVMACIAKSIGLLRPQRSQQPNTHPQIPGTGDPFSATSTPTRSTLSPGSSISHTGRSATGNLNYTPSFGSLSMLDREFDESSSIATSEQDPDPSQSRHGYMSGLNNEVEILFFSAGSVLVKAGERNAGMQGFHFPLSRN
jgi:lysophospholipid hydrolase